MPAKRALSAALTLLLIAAIPARAASVPTWTVVDTINPGPSSSHAMDWSDSAALGGYLYFSANDGTHGYELWRTSGATTEQVEDIRIDGSSSPSNLTAFNGYLYFGANDGTHGHELWRTNGTTTELVFNINPTNEGLGVDGSDPGYFTAFGDYLYFRAYDATHGRELWRTDGTTTTLVKDINLANSGADSSNPDNFTVLGDYLYFAAYDDTNGSELWRTDGTTTTLVKDINLANSGADNSNPYNFTVLGDYLYFAANDDAHGYELWRTDGTTTTLVNDSRSGPDSSNPWGFTALSGYLYFQANDGINGNELWRTSGTETGLVQDICIGADDSSPDGFTALSGYLYFTAQDCTHGYELWRTDGTTTTFVAEINTNGFGGEDSGYPEYFTPFGEFLYFLAGDGTHGVNQIWRTDGTVTERVPFPEVGQQDACDCYDTKLVAVGDMLFSTIDSAEIGHEFAFLGEPLPPTNRDGSVWTATLVTLAGLTAAASIGLRVRGAKRA
jgi:ELWxxDGT repeat protein